METPTQISPVCVSGTKPADQIPLVTAESPQTVSGLFDQRNKALPEKSVSCECDLTEIKTNDTKVTDHVLDKTYVLPKIFDTPSFKEHLELIHIKLKDCKDIICNSCNRNLYSIEAKFSNNSRLLYCIDCYGYICKFCHSQGRKHSDWCSYPVLEDINRT